MAKIELHITADSPEDYHETLAGLVGQRGEQKLEWGAPILITRDEADAPPPKDEAPVEPAKRTRRTKEQIAADEAAAAAPVVEQLAPLKEQIAEANAEAASSVTEDEVKKALMAYAERVSMAKAKEIVATFKAEDGTPANRIGAVQPKDYAALVALLVA